MSSTAPPTNGSLDHLPADVEMKDSPSSIAEAQPLATQARTMAPPLQSAPQPLPPTLPNPHGAQARIYLNKNVTPHLLEGVKYLALERPDEPLKWLSEFLAKRSEEVEGSKE